ncbi:hypothetical protein [Sphingomonas glacialis]|nr:hypothetical protein [Sphingomonas glacialis]
MKKKKSVEHVLYIPDSPNVGDVNVNDGDLKNAAQDRAQADELAAKVSIGDELSAYEKVAGRGVPEP